LPVELAIGVQLKFHWRAVIVVALITSVPAHPMAQRSRCEPRTDRDYRTRYIRAGSAQVKVQLGPCVTEGLAVFVVSAFTRGAAIDHSPSGRKSPPPTSGPFTIMAAYPDDIGATLKMPEHQYSVTTYDHDRNRGEQFFIVVRGATVEIVGHTGWVY
jgi:hypothetical protein